MRLILFMIVFLVGCTDLPTEENEEYGYVEQSAQQPEVQPVKVKKAKRKKVRDPEWTDFN